MRNKAAGDDGTPPFITFRSEVANAIGDVRRALIRGDATRELGTLRSMLSPWSKDSPEFRRGVKEMEMEMLRIQDRGTWPRPRKPWWQFHYLSLLLEVAKRSRLLDIEAIVRLDEEGEEER